MKKTFVLVIALLIIGSYAQAQTKIIGEKGREGVIGEKSSDGIIGEKRPGDAALAKNNAQLEIAFAEYNRQREEMERSLAALYVQVEEGIRLLEKYKRFKSPKQGLALRNSWKNAARQMDEATKKIAVVKTSVVAPDMIR